MKKALSAVALALALTGSAFAADLPHYKAPPPPPPPPPPLWTGFYVGLNAGYTWSNSQNTTIATWPVANPVFDATGAITGAAALSASGILPTSTSGFIGGGQIGYNWQFYNSFVAGVEADIQGVAASNSRVSAFGAAALDPVLFPDFSYVSGLTATRSLDYLGTVRGRLGWLFTPTLLVYGTGGLAYGGVTANASSFSSVVGPVPFGIDPSFAAASFSDTRVGWTAGAGLEWMFWPNWSAKIEYLYYDLGRVAFSSFGVINANGLGGGPLGGLTGTAGLLSQVSTHFNGNIVRAGVNYHFNWGAPAPVVAKY